MKNESYEELLRKRAIRQKYLDDIVSAAMTRAVDSVFHREPPIKSHTFYGASAIHPRHLVIWYIFDIDSNLRAALESGLTVELEAKTRSELMAGGYPSEAVPNVYIAFTSTEDVQRKSGGDLHVYFNSGTVGFQNPRY